MNRDLTYRLLTVAETAAFDLAADSLEDLARAGVDAGRDLDGLGQDVDDLGRALDGARGRVDEVDRATQDLDLTKLGRDADRAADQVDDAFDAMGRSARQNADTIDRETRDMKGSLRDVGDEAGQTAREAAASFSGGGDIGDALQELAANAPAVLGPLGLAFGVVAGIGVGLFKSQTEKIREQVKDLVDQILADGGRLSEESIANKRQELAADGTLQRLRDLAEAADLAGISFGLLAQAKAGDEEALARLNEQLDVNAERFSAINDEAGNVNITNELMRARIQQVRQEFSDQETAARLAEEALTNYREASIVTGEAVVDAASTSRGAWDDLRGVMADPIRGRVALEKPSSSEIASVRDYITRSMGTLVVPVRPGQTRFSNTSSNSRYRE